MNARTLQSMKNFADAVDARRVLLRGLIDYAGLFPPAALSMQDAIANYDYYSKSEHAWMLGRFILPVARLGEFEAALSGLQNANKKPGSNWGLSVLSGADVATDLSRICKFKERFATTHLTTVIEVESIEIRTANVEEIERLSKVIPAQLEAYFEVPLTADVSNFVAAIAGCGRRAKIRTGGETPDKFPAPERIADFIRLCGASNVAFKATAGLHHPVRSCHRLTYQPDSPSGIMHGFLNVFLAAAFLRAGMDVPHAVELLKEQSATAFRFGADVVSWRQGRLGIDDLAAARRDLAISFGSCSFAEPVEDLQALGLL